ncbi:MAG TPA: hypothetical protein VFB12_18125 [Ktedonobacteraceae bacterium]|nr:hypothetical protein [Ktedonobacteraceae bacterium]
MQAEKKLTLLQLRRDYNKRTDIPITSKQIATQAGVALSVEFTMELGRPVPKAAAEKVISAFSVLAGQWYCLDDIEVRLLEESLSPISRGGARR